jgi:hypothetical protein
MSDSEQTPLETGEQPGLQREALPAVTPPCTCTNRIATCA